MSCNNFLQPTVLFIAPPPTQESLLNDARPYLTADSLKHLQKILAKNNLVSDPSTPVCAILLHQVAPGDLPPPPSQKTLLDAARPYLTPNSLNELQQLLAANGIVNIAPPPTQESLLNDARPYLTADSLKHLQQILAKNNLVSDPSTPVRAPPASGELPPPPSQKTLLDAARPYLTPNSLKELQQLLSANGIVDAKL